jgi:hypothetical protein
VIGALGRPRLESELFPRIELERVRVVCGPASAAALGVQVGYVIDPDEEPELYARHQAFALEQRALHGEG